MKYYQYLTKEEQQLIQDKIDNIDYFYKDKLDKNILSTLPQINNSFGDFIISLNNNNGFISGRYNCANKELSCLTIVNFDLEKKYKFYKEVLKCLKIIDEDLNILNVSFSVFKDLDYVIRLDEKLCNLFNLVLVSKEEDKNFINYKYMKAGI